MSFDEESFSAFIRHIAKRNRISLELAGQYAIAIGDTPELVEGEKDLVVVRDAAGNVIARVRI